MGFDPVTLSALALHAAEAAATQAATAATSALTSTATAAGSAASGAAGLAKTAATTALGAGKSAATALRTGVEAASQSAAGQAVQKYGSNRIVQGVAASAAGAAATQALAGSAGKPPTLALSMPDSGVDAQRAAAEAAERARRLRAPGRAATLLTSPLGIPQRANVGIARLSGYNANASGRGAALLSGAIGRTSLGGM